MGAPWSLDGESSQEIAVAVPATGRYRVTVAGQCPDPSSLWLEAYAGNSEGRVYDVTGPLALGGGGVVTAVGTPLQAGEHRLRLHADRPVTVTSLRFELLQPHVEGSKIHEQSHKGDGPWELTWSDEFEGAGAPNGAHWTADVGNWGWGNRELQFYTDGETRNARQEGGNLVIEAHPMNDGAHWTSARLTTRGKVSFLYGRIEMRAQVPSGDGTWAAGWLLGADYRDEASWPDCGTIDLIDVIGSEIDEGTGDGINHGGCHSRAFHMKRGNSMSNSLPVEGMGQGFHIYACEWTPRAVRLYVDGEHYYTYDQHGSPGAWPFDRPHHLVLNLAMGGGGGGPVGPGLGSQKLLIDYVRVFTRVQK